MSNGSNPTSVRSGHSGLSRASISVTLPTTNTHPKDVATAPTSVVHSADASNRATPDGAYSHVSAGTVPPAGTPTMTMDKREVERILSARIIECAWLAYRDKQMFRLLKHAVCAAENSISHEILRKVCPKEAGFLKDKCVQTRVRFRFGGREFPPLIYFKVYTNTGQGLGMKYFSGKRMIQPATEAAQDACDLMGQRKFLEQVIQDVVHQETHKITDEVDVTTLKDYMQYMSLLDETPSYLGGRDNSWRKLTLEDLPRQTIFYDVVQYLYSQKLSQRLEEELPALLVKPVNQDMLMRHIAIISEVRSPPPPSISMTPKMTTPAQTTGRRTKQARQRVSRMKKLYQQQLQAEGLTDEFPPMDGNEDQWEEEADKLYEWTQELSMDDMMATPRLGTAQYC